MNNIFNDLPDWDDQRLMPKDEEGEEWKLYPTRDAGKELYNKWKEVVYLLNGALSSLENLNDVGSQEYDLVQTILSDAHLVAVKIWSSEAGGIYTIRMGNAAIIREHAQSIASSLLLFTEDEQIDDQYIRVLRSEIEKFKELFASWVRTFEKDEFEDDWGLFV